MTRPKSIIKIISNNLSLNEGIDISSDGLKLVMVGTQNNKGYFYSLGTPNDLSTAANDATDDLTIAEDTDPYGVALASDGLKLYVLTNQSG